MDNLVFCIMQYIFLAITRHHHLAHNFQIPRKEMLNISLILHHPKYAKLYIGTEINPNHLEHAFAIVLTSSYEVMEKIGRASCRERVGGRVRAVWGVRRREM